jgi:adenylate cyclase
MQQALRPQSFDGVLGRHIISLHRWAVEQGLRGAAGDVLFDGFCQRLVSAGVPLWRAFAGMRTLHPQWGGYSYTWRRGRDLVDPLRRERGEEYDQDLRDSPFFYLLNAAPTGDLPLRLRRRLAGRGAQRDFPILEELAIAGATDYFAELIPVGMVTEAFPDNGIGFSFATDHPEGFGNDDLRLIEAVLPAVSLAIVSDAEHTIAAGLLAAYLGSDAGRRVHAGVVERGSVESIRAVLWYADIRGFTPIADATPGPALVEMLDDIFETLTAALRPHGGEVLKFLGDGMLASFAFAAATRDETCSHALAAAAEAMHGLDRLNADRARMGKPIAAISARYSMAMLARWIASTSQSSDRRSTR